MSGATRACTALIAVTLLACAPIRGGMREPGVDAAERIDAVLRFPVWSFDGRIAVSDGRDGGSARIRWQQDRVNYLIDVRAPVTGTSWRLSGDDVQCELAGARERSVRGTDPVELLARETGWQLPLPQVRDWVRGLAHSGREAAIERDAHGQPRLIREAGWSVEFLDWHPATAEQPAMPRRLRASRPPHQVRLAIATWDLRRE